jgi:hypothetical protein
VGCYALLLMWESNFAQSVSSAPTFLTRIVVYVCIFCLKICLITIVKVLSILKYSWGEAPPFKQKRYQYIKKLKIPSQNRYSGPTTNISSTIDTTPHKKAELFNKVFTSVFLFQDIGRKTDTKNSLKSFVWCCCICTC